jgi:release factor glutamine methyltransferase
MADAPGALARASGFSWTLDPSADVGRATLAASRRLREAGVESPQLDSALLMAHVLGVSKTWVYAHPQRGLTPDEITRFEALIGRRLKLEPVAYLIGHRAFYGLDLDVDRRVLIPRPETELLVERALARTRDLAAAGVAPCVADIGTGSGAIALAIAVNAPEAIVYATDLSADALAVAAHNIRRHGLAERVRVAPGDLVEALPEPVDVLAANLPYVATAALATLPQQVLEYEPILALDGGPDGLRIVASLFDRLMTTAGRARLRPGARLFLEIGAEQGDAAHSLAESAFPDAQVDVVADYAGLDRLLVVMM